MSVQPDWAAWDRLTPAEQAARLQRRHLIDTGREMPAREAESLTRPAREQRTAPARTRGRSR